MDVVRRVFVNGTDVDLLVIIIQGLLPLIFGLVKELLCPLPKVSALHLVAALGGVVQLRVGQEFELVH